MVLREDRTPGASGQTDVGPASQQRSLVRRGRRSTWNYLQGWTHVVNRGHRIRRGSEQCTLGQPSLAGSRGGGGTRDYPRPNAGPPWLSAFILRLLFVALGTPFEGIDRSYGDEIRRILRPADRTWTGDVFPGPYGRRRRQPDSNRRCLPTALAGLTPAFANALARLNGHCRLGQTLSRLSLALPSVFSKPPYGYSGTWPSHPTTMVAEQWTGTLLLRNRILSAVLRVFGCGPYSVPSRLLTRTPASDPARERPVCPRSFAGN